ncbi:MAG: hypothetical protein V1834_00165 [Candidatus Micrarchaeota archaeon]
MTDSEGDKTDAASLRDLRDAANKDARVLATANKQSLAKLKELYAQADVERDKRDAENDKVVALKKERDSLQKRAHAVREELNSARDKLGDTKDYPEDPIRLQERIEELEWVQQTEALSAAREKDLGKQITELRKKLPAAADARQLLSKIHELRKKLRDLIQKSDALHAKVQEHARASEAHHQKTRAILAKAAKLQAKVTVNFQALDAKRGVAQKHHDELVSQIKERESKEDAEFKSEERQQMKQLQERRKELNKQAQTILAGFKSGKKITMEELLILREAGLA